MRSFVNRFGEQNSLFNSLLLRTITVLSFLTVFVFTPGLPRRHLFAVLRGVLFYPVTDCFECCPLGHGSYRIDRRCSPPMYAGTCGGVGGGTRNL